MTHKENIELTPYQKRLKDAMMEIALLLEHDCDSLDPETLKKLALLSISKEAEAYEKGWNESITEMNERDFGSFPMGDVREDINRDTYLKNNGYIE